MRQYCLGASLFDLDDPSKEIGRQGPLAFATKMNEKVMYPMSCILAVRLSTTTALYSVSDYPHLWVVDMVEEMH
jgi:hypothetical protein